MTNLLPTSPLTFRVPIDILGDSLEKLGGFPLECTESFCPQFEKPALFIRGTQSGYIQPKHFPTMEKMFPKMKVVELDGSHWIHVDQPEGVFKTMYGIVFHWVTDLQVKVCATIKLVQICTVRFARHAVMKRRGKLIRNASCTGRSSVCDLDDFFLLFLLSLDKGPLWIRCR